MIVLRKSIWSSEKKFSPTTGCTSFSRLGIQCTARPNVTAGVEVDSATVRSVSYQGRRETQDYNREAVQEGSAFAIALRCLFNNGEHFQSYYYNYNITSADVPYKTFTINTYLTEKNFIILSCHLIDRGNVKIPSREFPIERWLRGAWVKLSVGAFASCQGVYNGSDEIRVVALTAVEDLGKPANSFSTILITVRRTLDAFVFATDYGKVVVLSVADVLGKANLDSIPLFSDNVLLKRVVLTTMF